MNRFSEILKKLGATPELSEQFQAACDGYREDMKATLEEQFKVRLSNAKKICVEEIDKAKVDLCKKVEIFLEARMSAITREAQKAAAIGESQATKTLREAKALLEGVQIGDQKNSSQANDAEVKQLRVAVRQLKEAQDKAELKAQRANTIALKVLQRNKILESKITTGGKPTASAKPPVVENKAGKPSLDSLKNKSSAPKTARAPITETVARPSSKAPTATESVDADVAAIASKMDGDPAFIR